MLASYEPGKS